MFTPKKNRFCPCMACTNCKPSIIPLSKQNVAQFVPLSHKNVAQFLPLSYKNVARFSQLYLKNVAQFLPVRPKTCSLLYESKIM